MQETRKGRGKRNTEETLQLPSPCDAVVPGLLVQALPGQTQAGLSRARRLDVREEEEGGVRWGLRIFAVCLLSI